MESNCATIKKYAALYERNLIFLISFQRSVEMIKGDRQTYLYVTLLIAHQQRARFLSSTLSL